jgi:4-diphosphocytidyl-2-C-methyl-D-erythritol kinase
MQTIDLYDHITIEKSDTIELECDDPSITSDSSNLAFKAAALLQQEAYFPGARIILKKRIPVGSGLGGGSSDAAFVMRGLSQLYNLDLSSEQKKEIAGEIGSDVPFFLSSGRAIVGGRGEKIFPVKTPLDYGVIVIAPPVMSSTADTYRKLKIVLTKSPPSSLLKRGIESLVLSDIPGLENLKEILIGSGCLYSSVTGSGAAVFGITRFSGKKDYNLGVDLRRGYRIFQCRPVLLPPF